MNAWKAFSAVLSLVCLSPLRAEVVVDPTLDTSRFEKCLEKVEALVESGRKTQDNLYVYLDDRQAKVQPEHRSLFLRGQAGKGAALVLHGIMSSPQSLKLLIDKLHERGMTVYAPLVWGFGSSSEIENSSQFPIWQMNVDEGYTLLSMCFKEISLVGFSMGGALATDFTLNRYPQKRKLLKHAADLSSLVLLAPAIKPAEKGGHLKSKLTPWFIQSIPFSVVSKLRPKDTDIKHMMEHPEQYNQYFSVSVARGLLAMSDALMATAQTFEEHLLPVSLDYSQADLATDWKTTREYLTDKFFDVHIYSYKLASGVPHTLHLNEANKVGNEIRSGVVNFIKRSRESYWWRQQNNSNPETESEQRLLSAAKP